MEPEFIPISFVEFDPNEPGVWYAVGNCQQADNLAAHVAARDADRDND